MTAGSAARAGSQWAGAFTRSEALRGWTLLSPTVIVMVAGLAAPLAIMLLYSFWKQDGLAVDTTLTIVNYQYAITKYWPIFLRSLWISGLVTAATVLLAYPIAYYVAFHVKTYKFVWLILLTIPFWTSYLLRVFAWRIILARDGIANSTLQGLGITDAPISWLLFSDFAIVLTLAHAWAAFAILPIYVSLEKVDRTLLEAAADLGDGPIRSFWRITFPLSMPGVVSAIMLIFVPTIGDYVTPDLVGGPTGGMIAKTVSNGFKGNDWPLAAATAILSMIFVASVAFMVIALLRKSLVDPAGALIIAGAAAVSLYFGAAALGIVRANAPEGTPAVAATLILGVLFVAGAYYGIAAIRAALGSR